MSLCVITAIWKRYEVTREMLRHLRSIHDGPVVVAGSEGRVSRQLAEDVSALYVEVDNDPLGAKWNRALRESRRFDVDGVLVLGSDNFCNRAVLDEWEAGLADGVEYQGIVDAYMYERRTDTLAYWMGYEGWREGEPIGSARCYSRQLLDRLSWTLWDSSLNKSLDYSVTERLATVPYVSRICSMHAFGGVHLGVKTASVINRLEAFMQNQPHRVELCDAALVDEWFGPGLRNGEVYQQGAGI